MDYYAAPRVQLRYVLLARWLMIQGWLLPPELLMIRYLLTRTGGDSSVYAKLHRCKIYRAAFIRADEGRLAYD